MIILFFNNLSKFSQKQFSQPIAHFNIMRKRTNDSEKHDNIHYKYVRYHTLGQHNGSHANISAMLNLTDNSGCQSLMCKDFTRNNCPNVTSLNFTRYSINAQKSDLIRRNISLIQTDDNDEMNTEVEDSDVEVYKPNLEDCDDYQKTLLILHMLNYLNKVGDIVTDEPEIFKEKYKTNIIDLTEQIEKEKKEAVALENAQKRMQAQLKKKQKKKRNR